MHGIPAELSRAKASLLTVRLVHAVESMLDEAQLGDVEITVTGRRAPGMVVSDRAPATDADGRTRFAAVPPKYGFDFLVLPDEVMGQLLAAVAQEEHRSLIYDVWNLRSIKPHPGHAVNLHGPPGTGKTLAAHALAARLGRKLVLGRYSELESRYHGDGPKNLVAIFEAAQRQNAVLFLDEADSLTSRRIGAPSQGSEHAINAMRTELFMCLDRFPVLTVLATNQVSAYDPAFSSRIRHIRVPLPDKLARRAIWQRHLPPELPLARDVSVNRLAEIDGVSGREICQAVIDAATGAADRHSPALLHCDFVTAIEHIKRSRPGHDRNVADQHVGIMRAAMAERPSRPDQD
ncbi:ATP-binding protein [Spirillospora sp. CA-294931]|uniref:ATP-binding protein n=1 Tax=Spirillospora sp. CA-294931 TaxID=3240042 RepID=UPI003D8F5BBB